MENCKKRVFRTLRTIPAIAGGSRVRPGVLVAFLIFRFRLDGPQERKAATFINRWVNRRGY